MSWTFLRRELRRQTPAGIGLVALGGLLLLTTLALSQGGNLDVVAGLLCLLTPALLGVHAFGPDLEQGQEQFLSVLPVSRARVGLMRLGVAVGVTLAVDGTLLALLVGISGGLAAAKMADNMADLLWVIRLSLLLLPLGAVAAVSMRHTLAALAAVVAALIAAPVALAALDDYDLALDGALLFTVLGSMGGTSLWLYARARTKRPLRVALSSGALAVLVGFSPVPAYGGVRAASRTVSGLWNGRDQLWQSYSEWRHGTAQGVWAGPAEGVLTVLGSYDGESTLGISSPDGSPPLRVASGAGLTWAWQDEWLLAYDKATQTLTQFNWKTQTSQAHVLPLFAAPEIPDEQTDLPLELNVYDGNRLAGLHVDQLGDDLWVAPGTQGLWPRNSSPPTRWADGSGDVLNLTQGNAWTPPNGWEVAGLVQGWAYLIDRKGGSRVIHVTRGAEFDLSTFVPAELQTVHMQLVRCGDAVRLVGLVREARTTLWHLDLATPDSVQATVIPDLNLNGTFYGEVALSSASASQLWVHLDFVWSPTEVGLPTDTRVWSLADGALVAHDDESWLLRAGPGGLVLSEHQSGQLEVRRPGADPRLLAPLPSGHESYGSCFLGATGRVFNLGSEGNALVSRPDGSWEPAERTIGLPSSWDVLEPTSGR